MMAWFNAKVWAVLAAIGAVGAVLLAVFRAGKGASERRQLEERVRGAQERANADATAARAADPVNELRSRGWVRDVAPNNDRSNGQR